VTSHRFEAGAADAVSEATDEHLMGRVQQGDDAALGALMGRWEIPLKRFLYRMLLNADEAGDLAQETFVRVYQRRASFREGARFSSWILTIAANLARNRRRWWRRHPVVSLDGSPPDDGGRAAWEPADFAPGAAAQLQSSERANAVRAAVAALPHDLRVAVVLAEFEDKSHAEIAAVLACSAKAVEMRLYRARERLRRLLEKSPHFADAG
jgi:RNA polymerase sigma-70 factor (ECF subfamily)